MTKLELETLHSLEIEDALLQKDYEVEFGNDGYMYVYDKKTTKRIVAKIEMFPKVKKK